MSVTYLVRNICVILCQLLVEDGRVKHCQLLSNCERKQFLPYRRSVLTGGGCNHQWLDRVQQWYNDRETNSRGISTCISLHQRLIFGSVLVFLSWDPAHCLLSNLTGRAVHYFGEKSQVTVALSNFSALGKTTVKGHCTMVQMFHHLFVWVCLAITEGSHHPAASSI